MSRVKDGAIWQTGEKRKQRGCQWGRSPGGFRPQTLELGTLQGTHWGLGAEREARVHQTSLKSEGRSDQ